LEHGNPAGEALFKDANGGKVEVEFFGQGPGIENTGTNVTEEGLELALTTQVGEERLLISSELLLVLLFQGDVERGGIGARDKVGWAAEFVVDVGQGRGEIGLVTNDAVLPETVEAVDLPADNASELMMELRYGDRRLGRVVLSHLEFKQGLRHDGGGIIALREDATKIAAPPDPLYAFGGVEFGLENELM
jgi:hypothetical protein